VRGPCEHASEPSGSVKGGEFLDCLNSYYLFLVELQNNNFFYFSLSCCLFHSSLSFCLFVLCLGHSFLCVPVKVVIYFFNKFCCPTSTRAGIAQSV
jgi:hypothetical protein